MSRSDVNIKEFGQVYPTWVAAFREGATEWVSQERRWSLSKLYDKYFPMNCIICKRGHLENVLPLLTCSACKFPTYCGRDHQRVHWKTHKNVCKAITSLPVYSGEVPQTSSSWKIYLSENLKAMRLRAMMNGDDDPFNIKDPTALYSWLDQTHCIICFSTPRLNKSVILKACQSCGISAHCTSRQCIDEFSKYHTLDICERKYIGRAALVMVDQFQHPPFINCQTRISSLAFPSDWSEYFRDKLNDFESPFIPQFLSLPPVLAMVSECLSLPLTILFGLHKTYSNAEINVMKYMEIHVIGAGINDIEGANTRCHELLHWLPELRHLSVVFIGPDLPNSEERGIAGILCKACIHHNCSFSTRYCRSLYHQQTLVTIENATIAIACHSGLHEIINVFDPAQSIQGGLQAQWLPTIKIFSESNIPVIFTSYTTDEMAEDVTVLRNQGLTIVVEPIINPFRGLFPRSDPMTDSEFFYTNMAVCVVRGIIGPLRNNCNKKKRIS